MKSYVQQLKLNFDPFDVTAASGEFFEGGNRRVVCDRIVERAMYSDSIISVSGCLGSGKTSLAKAITRSFADDAVVVNIVATLFMNADQFLDELATALELTVNTGGEDSREAAIVALAGRLQLEAGSLLIEVDDAHEMSAEVLKVLVALKSESPAESLRIILFGESQLGNMLENTLEPDELAILAEFELDGFGSEATIDYVRFKLACAGFTKPLPLSGNELGAIHNASNGMPGAINALVREELEKQVMPEVAAVTSELEDLEGRFSADAALDESDYTEAELAEFSVHGEVEPAHVEEDASSSANRYFIAAGVLLVVFVAAIALIQPADNSSQSTTQIAVPTNSAQVSNEDSLAEIAQRARAISEPSDLVAGQTRSSTEPAIEVDAVVNGEAEPDSEPAMTIGKQGTASMVSAISANAESQLSEAPLPPVTVAVEPALEPVVEDAPAASATNQAPPAAQAETNAATVQVQQAPRTEVSSSELSSFERSLLSDSAANFTVQIIGALSETNIQAFVNANELGANSGYFETRLNGKPWYVVVAGSFATRESAAALLDSLPASVKASGPWVRSLAGIQSDIRNLQTER